MSELKIKEYVDSVWIMATGERPERAFSCDLESIETILKKFKAEIERQTIDRRHAELVGLVEWWDECCSVLDWITYSCEDDPPCRHFFNGSIDDNREESAEFLVYDAGRAVAEAALREYGDKKQGEKI